MTADDDSTRAPPGARQVWQLHRAAGTAHTVETALAPEPERYVRAWVYELSLKINRELRKELEQYDVEVQRRGRVSIDEVNEEIEEAKERLEMAYRRRARYFYRAVERREQETST